MASLINNLSIQQYVITSEWPCSEDGKVYLENVPQEHKTHHEDQCCTEVRHPEGGYTLIVDDEIKSRFPLEDPTDKKIKALARKYILMPDGEFKQRLAQEMYDEFTFEGAKCVISNTYHEMDSLKSRMDKEWLELSQTSRDLAFAQARLLCKIQKYEKKHGRLFSKDPLSGDLTFWDRCSYLIRHPDVAKKKIFPNVFVTKGEAK